MVALLDKYITDNEKNPDVYKPNLKGFMVGNGVTHWKYDGRPAFVEMAYFFSLIDDQLYFDLKAKCDLTYYDVEPDKLNPECQAMMDKLDSYMRNIQMYDVLGKCYFFTSQDNERPQLYQTEDQKITALNAEKAELRKRGVVTKYNYANFLYRNRADYAQLKDEVQCSTYDAPLKEYFNRQSVRDALHIDPSVKTFELCTEIDYTMSREATFYIYEELTKHGKYKILKYSGDSDGVLPTLGTQQWIAELNLKITKPWRAYTVGGQVAGYITEYENNFTFATIHGAGHMVPQWKRQQAYHAIFNWINNKDL